LNVTNDKKEEKHMGNDDDIFIGRLKAVVHTSTLGKQQANPPVSQVELARAEEMIGFPLPPLLRRIYLEVGNGGFGPGYGLYPLNSEEDPQALHTDALVTTYMVMHSATSEQMEAYRQGDVDAPPLLPEKVLMICDWGCNSYSWLDCSQPELPVLHSEATLDCQQFVVETPSFLAWLETWLNQIQSRLEQMQ
jgi:hypothetical protein